MPCGVSRQPQEVTEFVELESQMCAEVGCSHVCGVGLLSHVWCVVMITCGSYEVLSANQFCDTSKGV